MKKTLPFLCLGLIISSAMAQNSALHFDGQDDYVPVTSSTKLNSMGKITLETWVYVTNFNSSPCADCAPIIWNQQNSYKLGTGNTQKVFVSLFNGASTVTLTSAGTISAKTWHHIAATFSGTKIKLYIDGYATDSTNVSTFNIAYPSSSSDVWIADPKTGYGGILDETRIWDYARSPQQILEGTYIRYKSTEPGLALQLSYEDGTPYDDNSSVTSIYDKTKYTHTATPSNFAMLDSASNFVLGRSYCDTTIFSSFTVTRCSKYIVPSKKKTITTSGVYNDTIYSYRGCDSVMKITVKILKPSAANVTLANCDSVQNPVTKKYYKSSGKYTTTIPNYVGCDSVISYFVTIYKKDTTRYNYDACNAVKLNNGNTVNASGVYYDHLKGFRGCDSTIVHNVTIRKTTTAAVTLTMCQFVFCPTNKNKVFRKVGIYYDTITNFVGCDSIIQYTVKSASTAGSISVNTCGTYQSPSKKYSWTSSGKYYDTLFFLNYLGCDSFITINLTIKTPTPKNLNITACRSYITPSGKQVVTSSGTVTDYIKDLTGCDSIKYTINVTINRADANFIQNSNVLNGTTSNGSATFQWLDCNNNYSAITGATSKSFSPGKNMNVALAVTENSCTDTSACFNFIYLNNKNILLQQLQLYPNPGQGTFTLQCGAVLHNAKITLVNPLGEVQNSWYFNEFSTSKFNVALPAGLYFIRIESAEGTAIRSWMME